MTVAVGAVTVRAGAVTVSAGVVTVSAGAVTVVAGAVTVVAGRVAAGRSASVRSPVGLGTDAAPTTPPHPASTRPTATASAASTTADGRRAFAVTALLGRTRSARSSSRPAPSPVPPSVLPRPPYPS